MLRGQGYLTKHFSISSSQVLVRINSSYQCQLSLDPNVIFTLDSSVLSTNVCEDAPSLTGREAVDLKHEKNMSF